MLVGAGGGEGSMSAGNILKPALARGDLQCVGATTLDEYRMYIEKDAALARRFQTVLVTEPSVEDTISILRGIKDRYEVHHGVRIQDAALVQASVLANRYLTERKMPDKAIDLIDEAASRLRLQQESKPEPIWRLERDVMRKMIEIEALKKETDQVCEAVLRPCPLGLREASRMHLILTCSRSNLCPHSWCVLQGSKQRREKLESEVENQNAELRALTDTWEAEKGRLDEAKAAKQRLEEAQMELRNAERAGDFARAGELMHSVIPDLRRKAEKVRAWPQAVSWTVCAECASGATTLNPCFPALE